MRAEEVAKAVGGELKGESSEFKRFCIDSRKIEERDLFVAIKGRRHDGHDFIHESFKKGAVGAISFRDFDIPKGKFLIKVNDTVEALKKFARYKRSLFKGEVIGVAGSAGKTTTKDLIHFLLSKVAKAYKSEGNLNSQIGLPLVISNMPLSCDFAVFELGASRRGEVKELYYISKPRIRVITAIGEEHLETFGTIKDVIEGNGEIFTDFSEEDVAVIPSYARKFYRFNEGKVITFGKGGDIYAEDIKISAEGTAFKVKGEEFLIRTLSKGIVDNALASFCVLLALGYDFREFKEYLKHFRPPEGRMNVLRFDDFILIDDTYNANPLSVKNAIDTLSEIKAEGKRVLVLGDMLELGDKSEELHREIGVYAYEKGIDVCLFFGKFTEFSYEEFKRKGGVTKFFKSKDLLIEEVLKYTKDKNIILVKGSRGMRMEEVIERIKEIKGYGG